MKKDRSKERTQKYRERQRDKQAVAAEIADEHATIKRLNLTGFSEIAFNTPARTRDEEILVHRLWLRALQQPEILPGETLRQLAKRTWQALLDSKGYLVDTDGGGKWVDTENGKQWIEGFNVFYPLFDPQKNHFQVPFDSARYPQGPFCEGIRDGAKPGWFEENWQPPADCQNGEADQPIDINHLPELPKLLKPKLKPEPRVLPPVIDAPLETPFRQSGFGIFGVTRTSHA